MKDQGGPGAGLMSISAWADREQLSPWLNLARTGQSMPGRGRRPRPGRRRLGVRGSAAVPGVGRRWFRRPSDDPAAPGIPRRGRGGRRQRLRCALPSGGTGALRDRLLPGAFVGQRRLRGEGCCRGRSLWCSCGAGGGGRIIYLGGLGADHDNLSAHLRSRRRAEGRWPWPVCR